MNETAPFGGLGRRTVTITVAIVAGPAAVIGGTRRGVAAESDALATHFPTRVTTAIAHARIEGRDSLS
jgi:hypothetical protein